jgi:hypothetical protein
MRTTIDMVAETVFSPSDAEKFLFWFRNASGPTGAKKHEAAATMLPPQNWFEETPWTEKLCSKDIDQVMRGTVLVMRSPDGAHTDMVMRDHNMLDAMAYHYYATGKLPRSLLHADRHADFTYKDLGGPLEYNTWVASLDNIRRANHRALLDLKRIIPVCERIHVDGKKDLPLDRPPEWTPQATRWQNGIAKASAARAKPDWVSLDLDLFQPSQQFKALEPMLRDPRFAAVMKKASVRVFVLSPSFTGGGDQVDNTVNGSLTASLRLINALRKSDYRFGPDKAPPPRDLVSAEDFMLEEMGMTRMDLVTYGGTRPGRR